VELELTQALVEQWVALSDRSFTTRTIWSELGIDNPEDKAHLKVILNRLKNRGVICNTGEDGHWKKTDLQQGAGSLAGREPASRTETKLSLWPGGRLQVVPQEHRHCGWV